MEDIVQQLEQFFSAYPSYNYNKREIVLSGKEQYSYVYYIVKGVIKTLLLTKDGKELTVTLLGPHIVFPIRIIQFGSTPKYTFQALSPLEIKRAPAKEYLSWLKNHASVNEFETKALLQRLSASISRFETTLLGNAYQKVASTLLFIADNLGTENNGESSIQVPLTHQEIADMTGLARETVTVEIDKLKKEKLIEITKESILIKDALKDIVSIF